MTPISQLRGLHQGDPLPLLVFNLAFKPLLCTILANNQLRDAPLHSVPVLHNNKQRPCFVPLGPPSSETTSLASIKVPSTSLSHEIPTADLFITEASSIAASQLLVTLFNGRLATLWYTASFWTCEEPHPP
ncbi:hypothetical protein CU097_009271 [Rhizopus azygosporus]|uniref:Uncharacterized protein n=1 Tax=Rhizopus azygosporus TaxID=86630 RepID=A0A367JHX5_RHIAZ|nr:hypothetical protein CU097_009271 [Rhizopus azygosporus]